MYNDITALERAFQLAKSGACLSVDDIKKQLKAEGFSIAQVVGRVLIRQLMELIRVAQKK
jgi:hypothetical protein